MTPTIASLLIKPSHESHSGINLTHLKRFTENEKTALILKYLDGSAERKTSFPTVENTENDIYQKNDNYILKNVNPSK